MMKVIVNCGPCELYIGKCLDSLHEQTFAEWEAFVTIDPCGDRTAERAQEAAQGNARVRIRVNAERQFTMVNLIEAVRRSGTDPEDILVILDGDDWFVRRDALRLIADTYAATACWMTYGSWISDHPKMPGRWPAYPEGTEDFRNHEWLGTAVRTWKRWLWELIDDRDFRDAEGRYFRVTEDQATMLPMLEMCGTVRARHIAEPLMLYTRSSPHACASTRREEMHANTAYLQRRPPYQRLTQKPVTHLHRKFFDLA
jgi:glycosyltransferase involved in cell wall biosynthesis